MAARKKTAKKSKKKGASKGRPKGRTSKAVKKRVNRKSVIEKLIRKPMAELVRTGGLVSEAITVKLQRSLQRKGAFVGPMFDPKRAAEQRAEEKRLQALGARKIRESNLEKARAARLQKRMYGPTLDPQHASQLRVMREAGII